MVELAVREAVKRIVEQEMDRAGKSRALKTSDIKDSNKGSTAKVNVKVLTDMKRMMQHVERAGRELHVWGEDPESCTPAKVTRLYETIQWKFRIPPSKGTRRFEGISWLTYLDIVKRAKGKLVGDDNTIQARNTNSQLQLGVVGTPI